MNDDLKRLRAEAAKLRTAVSNKIARNRRAGVNIAGSEFDPRRSAGIEKRYNRAQLTAYIASMRPFMSRGNQFVPDANARPIPRGEFRAYKATEAAQAAIRAQRDVDMGDIKLPGGLTVRQQQAMVPKSAGSAVYGPYKTYDLQSTDFADRAAVGEMRGMLAKQLKSNFLPERIQAGRENLNKVLEILGQDAMIEKVDKLSDFQFDVFWFGTNIPEAIFMQYEIIQAQRSGKTRKEKWQDKVVEDAANELGPVLQSITKDVPRDRPNPSQTGRGRKTQRKS